MKEDNMQTGIHTGRENNTQTYLCVRILRQFKPQFSLGLDYIETWGYPRFKRLWIRALMLSVIL
jgi:hypothetical protein